MLSPASLDRLSLHARSEIAARGAARSATCRTAMTPAEGAEGRTPFRRALARELIALATRLEGGGADRPAPTLPGPLWAPARTAPRLKGDR